MRPRFSLRAFKRDDAGVAAIEFALIAPFLCLLLFGGVTVFDGLRATYVTERATSLAGDAISRRTVVTNGFLEDAATSFRGIARTARETPQFRVFSARRGRAGFEPEWVFNASTNTTLRARPLPLDHLPVIAEGDTLIVTETINVVDALLPAFSKSDVFTLDNLSVNRPRYVRSVRWSND